MSTRLARTVTIAALACCLPVAAAAGPKGDRAGLVGGLKRPPAFLAQLFRPEMVMKSQGAIGLTGEQRAAIIEAIRATQERLLPLQWELAAQSEEVARLFAAPRIDVEAGIAAAVPVMDIEQRIKKEHLRLLIQIKNELTPEQQQKLRDLAAKRKKRRR